MAIIKERLLIIDLARGFGILGVILGHIFALGPFDCPIGSSYTLFVSLLFISSGAVSILRMTTLLSAGSLHCRRVVGLQLSNLLRILNRVYIPYIFYIVLSILVYLLFCKVGSSSVPHHGFVSDNSLNARVVLSHLLFLQIGMPEHLNSLADGSWFLFCLLAYGLVSPLLFAISIGSFQKLRIFLLVSFLFCLSIVFFKITSGTFGATYTYYQFPVHLPVLYLGSAVSIGFLANNGGHTNNCQLSPITQHSSVIASKGCMLFYLFVLLSVALIPLFSLSGFGYILAGCYFASALHFSLIVDVKHQPYCSSLLARGRRFALFGKLINIQRYVIFAGRNSLFLFVSHLLILHALHCAFVAARVAHTHFISSLYYPLSIFGCFLILPLFSKICNQLHYLFNPMSRGQSKIM